MKFAARIFSFLALVIALSISALQAQSPERKTVEILGQKIYYAEAGATGATVILLHGLGGDATNWALTIPALAKNFHVYAPDQIGFGQSDKPQLNYCVGTYVDFLDRFYQKLGIAKATLVGNSLGGWIAASYALAHPDKVEKLVIVDGAGYSPKRWGGPELTRESLSQLNPSTIADTKKTISLVFANKQMATDQMAEQMLMARMKKGDGNTINQLIESIFRGNEFLDGKVSGIKTPSLVIWGREDGLTPLAMGKAYAEDLKGSELLVIDNCGHVPQLEAPVKFNEALIKFLTKTATASAK